MRCVVTDPPLGSNIFYCDMSLFREAWLGRMTDNAREAVVRTTGKRKTVPPNDTKRFLLPQFALTIASRLRKVETQCPDLSCLARHRWNARDKFKAAP